MRERVLFAAMFAVGVLAAALGAGAMRSIGDHRTPTARTQPDVSAALPLSSPAAAPPVGAPLDLAAVARAAIARADAAAATAPAAAAAVTAPVPAPTVSTIAGATRHPRFAPAFHRVRHHVARPHRRGAIAVVRGSLPGRDASARYPRARGRSGPRIIRLAQ